MDADSRLGLSIATAYGLAALVPLLRRSRFENSSRVIAGMILFCPFVVPADQIGLRAAATFVAFELFFRIVDVARQFRGRPLNPREYFPFLVPFPVLLVVFANRSCLSIRPRVRTDVGRVLLGSTGFVTALAALLLCLRSDLLRTSFLLDHAVKFMLFIVAIESISRALWGLERLAGFDTRPIVRNVLFSQTPAEFWARRYNHRVHDWLVQNVFLPTGGREAPVRGTLLVFLVSGLLHELAFGIATSRWDGYQLAFFLLQAPAVLVSKPLARLARRSDTGKVTAHALTFAWMWVTSMLFFRGVERIFPIVYASEPWLP